MAQAAAGSELANRQVGLDEVSRRGLEIYEARLKPLLEPLRNGEKVAIHVESGDYAVARTTGEALRTLRARYSSGPMVLMKIGPEPEHGLEARLLRKPAPATEAR